MKRLLVIIFAFLLLSFTSFKVQAATYNPYASTSLNKAQTNLNVYFGNVKKASSISYTLMYETNNVPQGVSGFLKPKKKNSISKSIFFGTCSNKVCVSHKKLKKVKIEVMFNFPGKTITKTYTVKVR